ncbi:CBS domain-containing protein [Actinoallomurus sp. CA-150999]|uniref:CBS domain-containing protein n=1 Tax=Actinoallomurus sp. CA-150999 TaxID=3239887 RepID=UPI003D89F83D
MRSPLTGLIFPLELTHAWATGLPLLIAATSAYALSTLLLDRSVLTEKIARRGLHLTREYSIDPLEGFFARDVVRADPVMFRADQPVAEAADGLDRLRLYPVVNDEGRLAGVVTQRALRAAAEASDERTVADVMVADPVAVFANDTLCSVAYLFAEHSITRAPVIRPDDGRVLGVIALGDLLEARLHDLTEESHRERHLRVLRWWGDAASTRDRDERSAPLDDEQAA